MNGASGSGLANDGRGFTGVSGVSAGEVSGPVESGAGISFDSGPGGRSCGVLLLLPDGAAFAAGIWMMLLQVGHFPFFPAAASGVEMLLLQTVHWNLMVIPINLLQERAFQP